MAITVIDSMLIANLVTNMEMGITLTANALLGLSDC